MKIELKEKSQQMDIKEMVIKILLNSKTYLLDYPYQSMKEGLWERDKKSLEVSLALCTNPYVSSCCKYDVYTNYISSLPKDEKLLEWLREGGKLGSDVLIKYNFFSVCFKCKGWCGLLEDNFFTFSHESDTI